MFAILESVIWVIGLTFLVALNCSDKSTSNKIPNAPSGLSGYALSASSIVINWNDKSDNETKFLVYRKGDGDWSQAAVAQANVVTFTDTLLADSSSYFYRISAANEAGESAPSDSISITTYAIGQAPAIPSNPSPSDDSSGTPVHLRLMWSCSDPDGDSLVYDIYLGTGSYLVLIAENVNASEYEVDTLSYNIHYNWRVIAKDNHAHATSGPVWHFTTKRNTAPHAPNQPSPANGAVGVARDVILQWQCSDPDSEALTYNVYFAPGLTPVLVTSDLPQNSYSPELLSFSAAYSWKIIANDSHGNQTSGPLWTFVTCDSAYTLDILLQGMGQVSRTPDRPSYSYGDTIMLNAVADPGWYFFGWSGDTSGNVNPLTIIIQRNMTLTAEFHQGIAPATISGTISWPGHTLTSHTYAFADTFVDRTPYLIGQADVNPADGSFTMTINNITAPLHLRFEAQDDVNNSGPWNHIDSGDGWGYYDYNGDGAWSNTDDMIVNSGDHITGVNITLQLSP